MSRSVRILLNKHNRAAQVALFRSIAGGSFQLMHNWGRGYSGLQIPIFNVFMPFTPDALNDDTLADTAAFFSSRDSLYAVEIIHDTVPRGPDFLYQRRYTALPPQPAMFSESLPTGIPTHPDITVQLVTTVPGVSAFCTLQNEIFDFNLQDMRRKFPVAQLKEKRITHYLAFVNESPVGCGTTVKADGVVSVWNVGVLDEFRHIGVGALLVQHMLADARQQGNEVALLFSTAQAYNFFTNLGFEIFTQRQWFLPQNIRYEVEGETTAV